jgi:hypothetical protein
MFLSKMLDNYVRGWDAHCMKCGWRMKEFDRYKEQYNQLTKSACEDGDSKDVRGVCDQCGIENTRYAHNWHLPIAKGTMVTRL